MGRFQPGFSGSRSTRVFTIAADADDGFFGKAWINNAEVLIGLTSSTWRFQNVLVPQGVTVISGLFTAVRAVGDTATCSAIMSGDDVDNSPALNSSHNRSSGWTSTTATQAMTGTNPANPACDVTAILQEIFDRPGWLSGHALSLGADATGSTVEVDNQSATLRVTYSI